MAKPPEAKKQEEVEVEITRTEIDFLVEPGVVRKQLAITFWSPTIPPQTIFMWKDEWSEEKEKKAIAEKIKELREAKPTRTKITL